MNIHVLPEDVSWLWSSLPCPGVRSNTKARANVFNEFSAVFLVLCLQHLAALIWITENNKHNSSKALFLVLCCFFRSLGIEFFEPISNISQFLINLRWVTRSFWTQNCLQQTASFRCVFWAFVRVVDNFYVSGFVATILLHIILHMYIGQQF